jgi:hypothetical protein
MMGWFDVRHEYMDPDDDLCAACNGRGKVESKRCPRCAGTGTWPWPWPHDRRGRPKLKDRRPAGAYVEWWEPVTFTDVETGERETIEAPASRGFCGPNRVAWKAADRFSDLMRKRGKKHVTIGDIES